MLVADAVSAVEVVDVVFVGKAVFVGKRYLYQKPYLWLKPRLLPELYSGPLPEIPAEIGLSVSAAQFWGVDTLLCGVIASLFHCGNQCLYIGLAVHVGTRGLHRQK